MTFEIPSLFPQTLALKASRLTTILIDWAIDHAWDGLTVDGEEMFGGFRTFFEEEDDEFGVMGVSDDGVMPKKSKSKKSKKNKKEKVKKPKLRV